MSKKYPVGKEIGGELYIHISALDTLPGTTLNRVEEAYNIARERYPLEADYISIVKINPQYISLIYSPDFDTTPEPVVDYSIQVKNGVAKLTDYRDRVRRQIYHHKWEMVKPDYRGFDYHESKERSKFWLNHPHVLAHKENGRVFSGSIGYQDYWKDNVLDIIFKSSRKRTGKKKPNRRVK